jgi:hypothetical protein
MTSEYAFLPPGHAHHLRRKGSPGMAAQDFQHHASTACISEEEFQQIVRGDIITYLLAPEMQPTNPLRQWHGRVEEHDKAGWVEVTVLDEGYVGDTDIVRRTEILAVRKSIAR